MSMISNLIDRLNMESKNHVQPYVRNLLKEAAMTIEELSAKLNASQMEKSSAYYNSGWIPCEERKQGFWIPAGNMIPRCPFCDAYSDDADRGIFFGEGKEMVDASYCPNCGARLDFKL